MVKAKSFWNSPLKVILTGWLVAGTLDLTTAVVVYSFIMKKVTALKLLQGIASGVYGKSSFTGGIATALAGAAFHYSIALSFTLVYFFIFPKIPFRMNWIIAGLAYGLFVWIVMNLVVIRLFFPNPRPITWDSFLIGAAILMVMIGLPISFFISKYYLLRSKIG